MIDIVMVEGNEGNEEDRDEEEVNVQDKSSEEQLGQILMKSSNFIITVLIFLFIHQR